jgi:LacI family transcriptional regulator, galactose operon repressor
MMRGRTTIKELARLSGVSVGTVSRALNGYTDVSPDTRERVMRLAEELDYTPAAAARTLVMERSHVIGIFLETGEGHPDVQHPFFHEVLGGLKDQLGAAGFDLLLFASEQPGNGYGPHSYLKRARHHNVGGTVLMGVDTGDPDVERLLRSDIPCVGVDVTLTGTGNGSVMSDNAEGAAMAVRHLAERGHKRIATITGLIGTAPARDRLRGYREEIQRQGLAFRDDYVAYGDYYVESGAEGMERLLELPEPPTAVFAASDLMAVGALGAAGRAGLSVPDDFAIVGFDDILLAGLMQPPLTTLRQDKQGLGAAAGETLLALMEEEDGDASAAVTLPVELVVRGSTTREGQRP